MIRKWLVRLLVGGLIVLVLGLIAMHVGMSMMQTSDQDVIDLFAEVEIDIGIDHVEVDGLPVRAIVEKSTSADSHLVIMVHGAPGSWDAFASYMQDPRYREKYRMVALDRPGYGGSTHDPLVSIVDQAAIVRALIDRYRLSTCTVIGHSYGGPIAAEVACTDSRVDQAIIIAPLMDPDNEPIFWYSYFSHWRWSRWLLPIDLQVAGAEKFAHADALRTVADDWQDCRASIVHIHGMEDALAPPKENVTFVKEIFSDADLDQVVYPDDGHLLLWTEYDKVSQYVLEAMASLDE